MSVKFDIVHIDIAWNGWTVPLTEAVKNGSFLQLNDLLSKNAPELKEALPDWLWQKTTVDGKIYAIPNYQKTASRRGMYTQKELADKYLNRDY